MTERGRKILWSAGLAILLAGVVAVVWRSVDIGAAVERSVAFFRDAGPVPFFGAMALLPLVGVPVSPFTVMAGPVFGPTLGVGTVVACAIGAVALNVALSYWIAAKALRPAVLGVARWRGYKLPELPQGTAWEVTLLVRIIPGPPFFLQSYLLGLAQVPFGIYMVVSTIVPAFYLTSVILAGNALMRHDWRGLVFAVVLCLVAGTAIYRVRKRMLAARGKVDDREPLS